MAAGKKSPIIMAGVNDEKLSASSAARPSAGRSQSSAVAARPESPRVVSAVDLSAGQLPHVDPDRLRVDTGVLTVQVSHGSREGSAEVGGGLTGAAVCRSARSWVTGVQRVWGRVQKMADGGSSEVYIRVRWVDTGRSLAQVGIHT